ncbi:MAG: amphi-Trp domain-containing protein [Gammaproteobacteria bacterium]|nr:amphi-Trp domain-containing protein [Gammaproteobacteria bacterium]
MKQNSKFTHESLQDTDSIKSLLKAISNGIGKGKVQLEDEEGVLTLHPDGLLRLKITGLQDDDKNRLNIRITWAADNEIPEKKPIKVNGK